MIVGIIGSGGREHAICHALNKSKKIDKISFDEMLELSSLGAKVMQPSAVQTAMIYNIPLEVKSTSSKKISNTLVEIINLIRYYNPIFLKKAED